MRVLVAADAWFLEDDLRAACLEALALSRTACRVHAETMSWDASARCFLDNAERAGMGPPRASAPLAPHAPSPEKARSAAPGIG